MQSGVSVQDFHWSMLKWEQGKCDEFSFIKPNLLNWKTILDSDMDKRLCPYYLFYVKQNPSLYVFVDNGSGW